MAGLMGDCIWPAGMAQRRGCIGLRRFDAGRCEMKRLYVRPAFAEKIGNALAERTIADARAIG